MIGSKICSELSVCIWSDILGIKGIPKASSKRIYTSLMIAKRMISRTWKNIKDLSVVRVLADLLRASSYEKGYLVAKRQTQFLKSVERAYEISTVVLQR